METLEFVIPVLNFKAVMPQIILTVTALAVLLIDVFTGQEDGSPLPGVLSLLGVLLAGGFLLTGGPPGGPAYSGMLMHDRFADFITLTVCLVTLLTVLVSMSSQRFFPEIRQGEYYCLVLLAAVGMTLMGAAGNLIMLFVALETMSIPIYVLAGIRSGRDASVEAALKYFLLGAFASAFLLFGFALIYGATGSMDLLKISDIIKADPQILKSTLMMGAVALMSVGFGFKVAIVPFHMWTPDVYQGAPTSITGFMAAGVKAAAFAGLLRVFYVALGPLQMEWTGIMWLLALLTMTVGNVVALAQENVKRMLAYSSIAHAGYLLVGLVAGGRTAMAGILFYLMSYALMNLGAFGIISLMIRDDSKAGDFSDFEGLGDRSPALALAMSVFMFSLAGIPPMAGFMGKLYIFGAAIKAGFVWLAVLGVINSVISIYYYLRVIVAMYFKESEPGLDAVPSSPSSMAALLISAAGVLLMGIFPAVFWNLAIRSADLF